MLTSKPHVTAKAPMLPAVDPSDERLLYDGPPQLPLKQLVIDIALCLLIVGLPLLAWHVFVNQKQRFRVTTRGIRYESGWIHRRIEIIELFKVRDLHFESTFGRGIITVHSQDTTTPLLRMPLPDAQAVFDALTRALPAARQQAQLALRQDY